VLVSALALALTLSLSSHALSVEGNRALAVAADLLHTITAGAWIGSLFWVLATAKLPDMDRRGLFGAQLQMFSPIAVVAVATLVLMGSYLAWEYLITLSDLWSSVYGLLLLAKIATAAAVLLAGFINWRRGMPNIDSPDTRSAIARRAAWEVGTAVLVLLLTGFLTGAPRPYVPSESSVIDQAPAAELAVSAVLNGR
jgi:putative copper export protein